MPSYADWSCGAAGSTENYRGLNGKSRACLRSDFVSKLRVADSKAAGLRSRSTQSSPQDNVVLRWLVRYATRTVNWGASSSETARIKGGLRSARGWTSFGSDTRQSRPHWALSIKERSCCSQFNHAGANRFFICLRSLRFEKPNFCRCQRAFVCVVLEH